MIAAPAQRMADRAAPANTAASSKLSVVFRPPERADDGDMSGLAGMRVRHASIREFVSNSSNSPSVTVWRTTKARCPTRQSPSPR